MTDRLNDMFLRPLRLSVMLIVSTLLAGAAVRFAPLGPPRSLSKYGGSMLWALLLYSVVSTLLRHGSVTKAAIVTAVITAGVEVFKLYDPPTLDAFRHTLLGMLALGRVFSPWDVVAYWIAIALGASWDRRMRRSGTALSLL